MSAGGDDGCVTKTLRIKALLYPKTLLEHDGWGVYRMSVRKMIHLANGQRIHDRVPNVKVKGVLPLGIGPYYQYSIRCVEELDATRGGRILSIRKVIAYKKDKHLSRESVEWILQQEMLYSRNQMYDFTARLPWATKRNTTYLLLNQMTAADRAVIEASSYFDNSDQFLEELVNALPGNTEEIRAMASPLRLKLVAHLKEKPWQFAFPAVTEQYGLPAPLSLQHIVQRKLGTRADLMVKAIALYHHLEEYTAKTQHTVLYTRQFLYLLNRPLYPPNVPTGRSPTCTCPHAHTRIVTHSHSHGHLHIHIHTCKPSWGPRASQYSHAQIVYNLKF